MTYLDKLRINQGECNIYFLEYMKATYQFIEQVSEQDNALNQGLNDADGRMKKTKAILEKQMKDQHFHFF